MIFASPIFLFAFLPFALLAAWLARGSARNWVLLLASLLFYAWGEPVYVLLMLFSIAVNYGLALAIETRPHMAKALLTAATVFNLGLLLYFKYANFFLANINRFLHTELSLLSVTLPIGISFYTFQVLSYVIDVYRGTVRAQHSPVKLATYITMFPQLIAGPIVRYTDIAQRLDEREITFEARFIGCRRFCIGLAKKVLLSNQMSIPADAIFAMDPAALSAGVAWLGAITYAMQIYFDFSGYSDMAIGLGKMLGFDFLENFNYPYIARSIQDFWRRWHISLSSWFRDYVYIPLGGSRRGQWRQYRNLLIVFTLCGLWHGAQWTFLAWGLYHGFFLVIERLKPVKRILNALPYGVSLLYTLVVVCIGWVFFRAETLSAACAYIGAMFGLGSGTSGYFNFSLLTACLLVVCVLCSLPIIPWLKKRAFAQKYPALVGSCLFSFGLLTFSALALFSGTNNPFIYFRF